jgi:ubiquinone biosynthesis protein UbiJ
LAYRVAALDRSSICFKLRRGDFAVLARVEGGVISLSADQSVAADVTIIGGFADFLAMVKTQREGTALAAGKLEIQGDLATAQQIQTLLASASIDIEGLLGEVTGDVFARFVGRGVRGGFKWMLDAHDVAERDISEYLQFESRLLPTSPEIDGFVRDCAALAGDVERLHARVIRVIRSRARA